MTKRGDISPFQSMFVDKLHKVFGVRNDAELARALDVDATYIWRIRHGVVQISDGMLVKIHDRTDMLIRDIRALAEPVL